MMVEHFLPHSECVTCKLRGPSPEQRDVIIAARAWAKGSVLDMWSRLRVLLAAVKAEIKSGHE